MYQYSVATSTIHISIFHVNLKGLSLKSYTRGSAMALEEVDVPEGGDRLRFKQIDLH